MLSSSMRHRFEPLVTPLARAIAASGAPPNLLTLLGFALALACGVMLAYGRLPEALLLLLLSGALDVADGAVARLSGRASSGGAFLDSVTDRYSDAAVVIGLSMYTQAYLLGMLGLLGCLMVSYTRARAENFIPRCDVGIGERAERMMLVAAGLLLSIAGVVEPLRGMYYTLLLLTLLAHSTAITRISFTLTALK